MYRKNYSVLLVDLPGYGYSTMDGRDRTNPKIYKDDSPNMITGLLDAFKLSKVYTVNFCGGAANIVRAIT